MSHPTNYPAADLLQDIPEHTHAMKDSVAAEVAESDGQFAIYRKRAVEQAASTFTWVSRRNTSIVLLVLAAHLIGVTILLFAQYEPVVIPKKKEVIVEFVKPVIPEQKTEPPPPPPPPPPKAERKPQAAKSAPALKTQPVQQNISPDDITVQENTTARQTAEPVAAVASTPPAPVAAEPAPPPPPREEAVTEAKGYAGYLNNPPPEYPVFAQRQGWQGKVILRVRVLANGKAGAVEVKQSAGRKILDDAAQEVVKSWVFAPAKRGNTAIDGWATVPIEFRM